ncbi:3-phosphoinositide-dependent protein kinase-1 [Tasmannia lanceolata]|uniref:3-phosphoinositide-dependent protein kinase-1 n=1 Tax=Tasmannia lanceolata TaxID=3420 RepID=UPI004063ADDC
MAVSLSNPVLPLYEKMGVSPSNSTTWEEIELSESYLVCCMFEEATSLASSILRHLCKISSTNPNEDVQWDDMMESAGMVLVQALKELGRTSEILNELKALFGSATAIPVQVLLTGACFQIAEGRPSGLRSIFEEFLGKWKYVDGKSFYVCENVDPESSSSEGRARCSFLGIERYMEVAEVYAVRLLGMVMKDTDLAISWVEKAELPEERRQEMLRKLHSLYSSKESNSSLGPGTLQPWERSGAQANLYTNSAISEVERFSKAVDARRPLQGVDTKPAALKSTHPSLGSFSKLIRSWLWWFPTVTLKIDSARIIISQGRVVLWGSLFLLSYYVLRRKGTALKRAASKQALLIRKALIDMWQLAFSVQVNPLAAVQSLTVATHGAR